MSINIYESRAPHGGPRVTNTVTFERASVYSGHQETGRIREENTPAHLSPNQMKDRLVFGPSRCWYHTVTFTWALLWMPVSWKQPCRIKRKHCAIPRRVISIRHIFPKIVPFTHTEAHFVYSLHPGWSGTLLKIQFIICSLGVTQQNSAFSPFCVPALFLSWKHRKRRLLTVCDVVVNYSLLTNLYK